MPESVPPLSRNGPPGDSPQAVERDRVRELELREERLALAVEGSGEAIWDWDLVRDQIHLSPRWYEIAGQPEQAPPVDPQTWLELVHPTDRLRLRAAIDAHLSGRTPHLISEHRIRHADGTWRWVIARGLAICDGEGRAVRMAGAMTDITDRPGAGGPSGPDALHDDLTGLPNRALLMDRATQLLRRAARDPAAGGALLFLDIDGFKQVNDDLSHAVGDHLLIALARRLASLLRPGDTVARIGGDEFALLLENVTEPSGAVTVAERALRSLQQPFAIDGHALFLSACLGIALGDGNTIAEDLLRDAEVAMLTSKRRGEPRLAVFDRSMTGHTGSRAALESELRRAVEESLLAIHYQPIVDLKSGRITALEALARWPPEWNEVAPFEFVPVAEDTGLIGALGLHVLRCALESLARWRADGLVDEMVCVTVNVSGRQVRDPQLPAQVRAALAAAGLPASLLRLELGERALMDDPEAIRPSLAQVCRFGVGLHLDDFGTGQLSLATLNRVRIDALKVDRSFVAELAAEGSAGEMVVRSTMALARSLEVPVIAEGIEDAAQLQALRRMGCEYGQGFLFSRPLGPVATEELLAGWNGSAVTVPA